MEKENLNFEQRNLLNEQIETARLLLVPISMRHKEEIFREFTDDIATYMIPTPAKDVSETEEFINDSLKGLENGSNLQLVIVSKDSKEFLGCAGLHDLDGKTPEFGVWLKKTAHGNGYGKEAMIAVKQWADENLKYDYLLYPAAENNISSRKVAEGLGGKIEREYDEKNLSGITHHFIEYRIYPDNQPK